MTDSSDTPRYREPSVLKINEETHFTDWRLWIEREAKIGAWSYDVETQNVWWSDGLFRIYELENGSVESPIDQYFDPEGGEFLRLAMDKAIHYGEGWDKILRFHSQSGEKKWVRSTGSLSTSEGRRIIQGTMQDVSDWYEDVKALQTFLASSQDFIMRVNLSAEITFINRTLTTLKESDVLGQTIYQFTPPEYQKIARDRFEEAVATQVPVSYETESISDGPTGKSWYLNRIVPVVINKKVVSLNFIAMDITREKELEIEKQRQRLLAEQQSRLVMIGQLAAGVGHEINNPLTINFGLIRQIHQLLKKNNISIDELNAALSNIEESCWRISDVVSGLRTLARNDQGESRCDAMHAIRESIKITKNTYVVEGITIDLHLCNDPVMVPLRLSALEQVILNLINNARAAMEASAQKTIEISTTVELNSVEIVISDTGQGIADGTLDKIFEPYYSKNFGNMKSGLGLSIAQTLVQDVGGLIIGENRRERGARFTITLPLV